MSKKITCSFSDVSERDMDMLFLEEFVCSPEFTKIFTDAVGICEAQVLSVHSSKTDAMLGESDMTVIVESNGSKIGLLIEDKIDAIAMPEQADRYFLRGQKDIDRREFDKFFVFIIAPKKYLSQNHEAHKYPNKIEYERILSYFKELDDPRAAFKIQQIKQAIEKQKKGYQVDVDTAVTEFWSKYAEYQKENYPGLLLLYNGEAKGSKAVWPRFNTVFEGLYMYHKTESGCVDLTFDRCADKILDVERLLSDAIGDYLHQGFTVLRTGRSAAIRLEVPALDLHRSFDSQIDLVKEGFNAIEKMTNIVKLFSFNMVYELLNNYAQK